MYVKVDIILYIYIHMIGLRGGVVVTKLNVNSSVVKAGLQPGHIIEQVNGIRNNPSENKLYFIYLQHN